MVESRLADIVDFFFNFIFKDNLIFIEEENPSEKVIKIENE